MATDLACSFLLPYETGAKPEMPCEESQTTFWGRFGRGFELLSQAAAYAEARLGLCWRMLSVPLKCLKEFSFLDRSGKYTDLVEWALPNTP